MFPQSSGCIINIIIPTIAIPLVEWVLQCGMFCDTEDLVCVVMVDELTAVGCLHLVCLVHNNDEVNILGIILMYHQYVLNDVLPPLSTLLLVKLIMILTN